MSSKHGYRVATSTTIDLSTPKRAEKDPIGSPVNTAETTPQSSASSSAKRRGRVQREKTTSKTSATPRNAVLKSKLTEKPEKAAPMMKTFKAKKEADIKFTKPTTVADKVSGIIFTIVYETEPGQDVFILGEDTKFGNWDTTNLGIPLKWTEGHVWTTQVDSQSVPPTSTFKFVIKEKDGSLTWETRPDRVFDMDKIMYTVRTSQRLHSKGCTYLDKGTVKIEYNESSGLVTLTFTWNK